MISAPPIMGTRSPVGPSFFYATQTLPPVWLSRLVVPEGVRRMSEEKLRTLTTEIEQIGTRLDVLEENIATAVDWAVAPNPVILTRFIELFLADPERAEQLVNAMSAVLSDPMLQNYLRASVTDLDDDELAAMLERLNQIGEDEWVPADEVRRSVLGE